MTMGAFEQIFCPGGGEFEKPDFKKFKFLASARGGDVEVSNRSVHWFSTKLYFNLIFIMQTYKERITNLYV